MMGQIDSSMQQKGVRLFPSPKVQASPKPKVQALRTPTVKASAKPKTVTKGEKGGGSEKVSFPTKTWLSSRSFPEATE